MQLDAELPLACNDRNQAHAKSPTEHHQIIPSQPASPQQLLAGRLTLDLTLNCMSASKSVDT
ncbi:hypothetical protein E2C01_006970 [Portunus trituberculatus]|uniref:Uncharacterized protein n=1 Tax=Portunus trituberculatus TaxID=210409 RepID=A0A5B7CXP7_PORTR|nr:hypothetical protein [Portunus trituberculatus]